MTWANPANVERRQIARDLERAARRRVERHRGRVDAMAAWLQALADAYVENANRVDRGERPIERPWEQLVDPPLGLGIPSTATRRAA